VDNHLKKVLVVDDEPKIIEVVKSFLESKGFTVFAAENGKQALEIFERGNIALIVLDLMLPDMTGEEICMQIRKKSRVPIIMLTAKIEEVDMLRGLNIGADDYITKPFSLKALYARIEAVLRRSSDDLVPLYNRPLSMVAIWKLISKVITSKKIRWKLTLPQMNINYWRR